MRSETWSMQIAPVPSVATPSLNVTVPVAVEGETVAVNVTDWFRMDGFSDEVRDVVDADRSGAKRGNAVFERPGSRRSRGRDSGRERDRLVQDGRIQR